MKYGRHYIQYNDLVFDEYDMVLTSDSSVAFKTYSREYTFKNGDYTPLKRKTALAKASTVTMTLVFRMGKIPCDERQFYRRFIIEQLTKNGKLWAVQGKDMLWAYAFVTNYSETEGPANRLEVDVTFYIPEGVWHKSDPLRTFLHPYNVCEMLDCYGYREINPCEQNYYNEEHDVGCCCDSVTKEMALCYHKKELNKFYDRDTPWKIVYDCDAAENFFFGDGEIDFGQKFCSDECGLLAGVFYSETDIPTSDVVITIRGDIKDPVIEINGNKNTIHGDFDGEVQIRTDGSVYYYTQTDDDCYCEPELLDVDAWEINSGSDYGWTINPGNNSLLISAGDCSGTYCAYIEADAVTV